MGGPERPESTPVLGGLQPFNRLRVSGPSEYLRPGHPRGARHRQWNSSKKTLLSWTATR